MVLKNDSIISKIYFPNAVIKQDIRKGQSVLDIGCATGTFLKYCDNWGLKTFGLDISKEWLKEAKKITKAELSIHDLDKPKIPFKDNSFHLITAFDVIEHLNSPYLFIKSCHGLLRKKGKLVLTTPNLNSLARFLINKKWHGYSDLTHKYLFTSKSLEYLLEINGFKVILSQAPFHPLPLSIQSLVNQWGLGGQLWLVAEK